MLPILLLHRIWIARLMLLGAYVKITIDDRPLELAGPPDEAALSARDRILVDLDLSRLRTAKFIHNFSFFIRSGPKLAIETRFSCVHNHKVW